MFFLGFGMLCPVTWENLGCFSGFCGLFCWVLGGVTCSFCGFGRLFGGLLVYFCLVVQRTYQRSIADKSAAESMETHHNAKQKTTQKKHPKKHPKSNIVHSLVAHTKQKTQKI